MFKWLSVPRIIALLLILLAGYSYFCFATAPDQQWARIVGPFAAMIGVMIWLMEID